MNYINIGKEVFDLEIKELKKVRDRIGNEVEQAVELIFNSKGRVVVTGIGKSGIIGKKITASLASTGTQSIFMNAAEGLHGDLGMIYKDDIVIAISNSGSSQEVIDLLPSIKRIGAKIIAMTGNINSSLGQAAHIVLDIGVEREACPMNLAPTSSTTATLVMGDAIAVALIKRRNFKPENFALYHPGGALGRRLLTRVKDLMHTDIPVVYKDTLIKDVIYEISDKRLGMTMVYNNKDEVVGLITDGDIRRSVFDRIEDIKYLKAIDIMTKEFKTIDKNEMANYALDVMDENKISSLVIIQNKKVEGILTMHDLFDFKKSNN
ncbi:KpsF/GutQ family sugar-phosphate isomerase [Paraclostridium bifermentans]|uniref:KpsF/GutQ family sugar-phosphate isomerase n=1 Tax=Paraclostridium bifermentans TaxID=1490 RepID=UPI00242CEC60|nr:KpsF/GutQ family sugar-phosphate isomerase [Paraclostridium bifermentans]